MNKGFDLLILTLGLLICACKNVDNNISVKITHEKLHLYKDTAFFKDGLFETFQLDFSGNRQGATYLFDQKGHMIGQGYYENNASNGTYVLYGSNGKIKGINNYKNDRLNGYHVSYTDQGELICSGFFVDDKKDGTWICYDTITKTISEIKHYSNDKCVGSEFFYKNDGKLSKLVFRNFDGILGTANFDNIENPKVNNKLNGIFYDENVHAGQESNTTILLPNIPGFFTSCDCRLADNDSLENIVKSEEMGSIKYTFNYQFNKAGIYNYICLTRIYNDKVTLFEDEVEFSIIAQ
jgi:hypothetical protein